MVLGATRKTVGDFSQHLLLRAPRRKAWSITQRFDSREQDKEQAHIVIPQDVRHALVAEATCAPALPRYQRSLPPKAQLDLDSV
jgi:hypothetical protein